MPREEPFATINRDLPSPQASFPFKRVKTGVQSSQNNRSMSESNASVRREKIELTEQKEQIERANASGISNIITGKIEQ